MQSEPIIWLYYVEIAPECFAHYAHYKKKKKAFPAVFMIPGVTWTDLLCVFWPHMKALDNSLFLLIPKIKCITSLQQIIV